ncbi:Sorbitol dehydrogenase [Staphylococcus gallinarum]|uniref:Sorbitol dehydrogenase n=1 Tax=Staphylococcus gallinarum TaxID=1293 RepID=A0A380F986_STAGA|nr:Sorbitol dehydrogenase [Staphylococcus gallinarum]
MTSKIYVLKKLTKPVITSPTDVIIKVKATGICGSDTSRYKKLGPYQKGMTFGHEFSGIVENVGSQVTSLTVGDRVTGCPAIVCHQCAQCEQGNYSRCESLYVIGSLEPGCFAEFVKLPISNVLKLPDNVDFTTAAMVEPSAVVAHGFYKTNMKPGAYSGNYGMWQHRSVSYPMGTKSLVQATSLQSISTIIN